MDPCSSCEQQWDCLIGSEQIHGQIHVAALLVDMWLCSSVDNARKVSETPRPWVQVPVGPCSFSARDTKGHKDVLYLAPLQMYSK